MEELIGTMVTGLLHRMYLTGYQKRHTGEDVSKGIESFKVFSGYFSLQEPLLFLETPRSAYGNAIM